MTREEFVKKFKVGNKVRIKELDDVVFYEILFYGERLFFYKDESGHEECASYEASWIPYTEPVKKKTIKMAQALIKNSNGKFTTTNYFYSSKEKLAPIFFPSELIQWPLVINGVEQWITVEVEE